MMTSFCAVKKLTNLCPAMVCKHALAEFMQLMGLFYHISLFFTFCANAALSGMSAPVPAWFPTRGAQAHPLRSAPHSPRAERVGNNILNSFLIISESSDAVKIGNT